MLPFKDLHYELFIAPDLSNFTFDGNLNLELIVGASTREVVLNTLDLRIHGVRAADELGEIAVRWTVEAEQETLSIVMDRETAGRLRISIRYSGTINDRMSGFYRSAVQDGNVPRWIAITQFQESDARRAFPCFDHPAAKGTFEITLEVDDGLVALSNMAPVETTTAEKGRRRYRFARTPVMSTYLVFFGVGDFEIIPDETDARVRLVTPRGRSRQGVLARSFGVEALTFCEEYFRIPFPLEKLDLLSVPDFAFGAMENWGAITFRENLLLEDPETTSKAGRARICEVVAHEITHQWFGNLATPAQWSYLWLNESFATYFGYGIMDRYHPEWETWDRFILGQTRSAMDRDALLETFPMEIPGGEHVVINTSTAPLIYSKGASILRQIHAYIGEGRFQDGLQRYLTQFAYANAESSHFWAAFDAVGDAPVSSIMKRWVEQKGYPLVTATREGGRLRLSQNRFTYLETKDDNVWPIPMVLRVFEADGAEKVQTLLMDRRVAEVEIGDAAAFKLNDGQCGFYRVNYADAENMEALIDRVRSGRLSARDRWGLQDDLYALALADIRPFSDFLDFVEADAGETAYLPAAGIDHNLFTAYSVLTGNSRRRVRDAGQRLAERLLSAIGMEPRPEESLTNAVLRDEVLWHGAVYGSGQILDFLRGRFDRLAAGGSVSPDIYPSVLKAGARTGGRKAFDWIRSRFETSRSEHERLALLQGMGSVVEPEVLRESFSYVMDFVPDRNRFVPLAAMASNPEVSTVLWDTYRAFQDRFADFHPLLYERVLSAVITGCGLVLPDDVRPFFQRQLEAGHAAADVIRLSLEKLEILLRLRGKG
ncbi:MAG: M1 family metallopeptidase [Desulfobacterales bacterium]